MYSPGLNDWEAYIRAYRGEIFAIRRGYYYHVQQRGEIGHQAAKGVSKVMSLPFTEFFFKKKNPPNNCDAKTREDGRPQNCGSNDCEGAEQKKLRQILHHSFLPRQPRFAKYEPSPLFILHMYVSNQPNKKCPIRKEKEKNKPAPRGNTTPFSYSST